MNFPPVMQVPEVPHSNQSDQLRLSAFAIANGVKQSDIDRARRELWKVDVDVKLNPGAQELRAKKWELERFLEQTLDVPKQLGWWDEQDLGWFWARDIYADGRGFCQADTEWMPEWWQKDAVTGMLDVRMRRRRYEKARGIRAPRPTMGMQAVGRTRDVSCLMEKRTMTILDERWDEEEVRKRYEMMMWQKRSGLWDGPSGKLRCPPGFEHVYGVAEQVPARAPAAPTPRSTAGDAPRIVISAPDDP